MDLPGNAPDYTYARYSRGLITEEKIVGDNSGVHSIQYDELGRMIGTLYSGRVSVRRWQGRAPDQRRGTNQRGPIQQREGLV